MTSKRSQEGYFNLDSRNGPIPVDVLAKNGLPIGAGNSNYEAPTYTCSHCQRVVLMNPSRTRERSYCRKCDAYMCDNCGASYAASGGQCRSFKRLLEEFAEAEARGENPTFSL